MARALAGAPRILFLDEATSNIDSATERLVGEALAALHGRVTVVAIAHRLSTIARPTRSSSSITATCRSAARTRR